MAILIMCHLQIVAIKNGLVIYRWGTPYAKACYDRLEEILFDGLVDEELVEWAARGLEGPRPR